MPFQNFSFAFTSGTSSPASDLPTFLRACLPGLNHFLLLTEIETHDSFQRVSDITRLLAGLTSVLLYLREEGALSGRWRTLVGRSVKTHMTSAEHRRSPG